MKTFKRNAVIITVVAFVCVAAYLNWSYNRGNSRNDEDGSAPADIVDDVADEASVEGELFYSVSRTSSEDSAEVGGFGSDFFAATRINRRQARDAAVETLASVNASEGVSQEVIDEAMSTLTAIARNSEKEAEVESLILAKGFDDCVVFISDDGVKVTVPALAEGLSSVDVARITDIVTSEVGCVAADIQIIEVK
jgi:stage III sporulation protein AH